MIGRSFGLLGLLFLASCASVAPPDAVAPTGPLQFVDLPMFDDQLGQALGPKPDTVRIEFIDKVKPSQLPERLKPWMTAVKGAGGEVKVVLPPGDLVPRGFPLLSLFPALWNALRGQKAGGPLEESLQGYDAQIILKNDATGDRLVESIVLKRR